MFQLLAPLSSDPQEACLHPIFFGSSSCRDATRISTKLGRERPFHANFLIICFIWSFGLSVLYHCYYSNGCFFLQSYYQCCILVCIALGGRKVRGAGIQEGVNEPPLPLAVSSGSSTGHCVPRLPYSGIQAGTAAVAWALNPPRDVHAVLASSALADGSEGGCLCCAECRSYGNENE